MSIFQASLLLALAYYLIAFSDNVLAWDATWRPLFAGWLTGLLLGDMKTGLIMGAQLEAVYMGISAIGGVIASDPISGTMIPVAYVILTGAEPSVALALAVPVGTALNYINTLCSPIGLSFLGLYDKLAAENNQKGYIALHYFYLFVLNTLPKAIVMFFAMYLGVGNLGAINDLMPQWLINGLDVASGMMVAIGFGILTSMIWSKELGIYFFVGFAMAEMLGMSTMAVTIFAVAIAIAMFTNDLKIQKATANAQISSASSNEEDLF